MKRIISMVLIFFIMITNMAFAEEIEILKLEDAIKRGLELSDQIEIDKMNISNARKVYEAAVDYSISNAPYRISKSTADLDHAKRDKSYNERKTYDIVPDQRKLEYDLEVKGKMVDENAIISAIYEAYYGLIKKDKEIALKEKEFELITAQYNESFNKYKSGMLSQNEYRLEYLKKQNAQLRLNSLKRTRKKDLTKLYYAMSDGFNPVIKPLDTNLVYDTNITDLNTALKNALENRIEIFEIDENIAILEEDFELIKDLYDDDTLEYKNIVNSLEVARMNFSTAQFDIEFEIRTGYNNLLNLLDTISINKREVEMAQIDYNTIKLKNELGMVTETEVKSAEVEYETAKNELDFSIIDFIIAKKNYELAQGMGYMPLN